MSSLRPILKGTPTREPQPGIPSFRGGHVHFPPTPHISATFFAHSAKIYDRSAIVVSPNLCALPKRHCPERTYVLSEGEGEARLIRSAQPRIQQEGGDDEDADDDPCEEYDQGMTRVDYFSISSTPATTWAVSDSDAPEITPNCGHPQIPMLEVSLLGTHTRGSSEPHEHVQATLAFLHHTLPPADERKRNVSFRDREEPDTAHTFSGGESNHCGPISRSRRPRRALSLTTDVPPDLGCLGGF